jgi:hypothetical protein
MKNVRIEATPTNGMLQKKAPIEVKKIAGMQVCKVFAIIIVNIVTNLHLAKEFFCRTAGRARDRAQGLPVAHKWGHFLLRLTGALLNTINYYEIKKIRKFFLVYILKYHVNNYFSIFNALRILNTFKIE